MGLEMVYGFNFCQRVHVVSSFVRVVLVRYYAMPRKVGGTKKVFYQKLSRIENGGLGRFLHFVWTRVNSSKLEPVVLSSSEAHQKIYFSMLSNFCFMIFFGWTVLNRDIAVRKTTSIYVDCSVAPPFGPKSKNVAPPKVSRIKNWVF